ncbi:receptor kinase-like protein Xa21 [Salvia splendens]|uniref:receptor kinase-like protein Xa21 n=1 Tax=Salvia splendens TaxID=180675 RepID=UPI001C27D298|nr:receptor kinase-like protein Xa21 [Salvia splendens]
MVFLTHCTNLETLELNGNHFTGSLPDSIGNLSDYLSFLRLDKNLLTGSIPSSIGNLVGLTTLGAFSNNLQGPIPSSIGKLHKLQEISLHENRLTYEIPSSFGNLTLLNVLNLAKNNLSRNNNLSGLITPEITKLSSIATALNLSHNTLTGTIPSEVGAFRNIGVMDLSHNRLSGIIPTSLGSCVMLSSLYLEGNSLEGEIPDSQRALKGLEYLDISWNNLSGMIPRYLVEFCLLYLNISFNELHGEVPTLGVFQNKSAITLEGNQDLCGGIADLNLPSCPSSTKSKKKGLGKILIPTVSGALCLALAACICVIMYKRRTLQNVGIPIFQVSGFSRLSYADLLSATDGFSEMNLLGAGRFRSVYKGTINDDDERTKVVAVKHGFMANGSLDNRLHSNFENEDLALSAIQRLNNAIDIASGVEYLHCGTDSIVIHGDLKPSNILLDKDMVAKIVSQILASTEGSSSSAIKGTIGYIAPASSNFNRGRLCTHCGKTNHTIDKCLALHGFPPNFGKGKFKLSPNSKDFGSAKSVNFVDDCLPDSSSSDKAPATFAIMPTYDQCQQLISLLQSQLSTSSLSPPVSPAQNSPAPTISPPFTGTTLFHPLIANINVSSPIWLLDTGATHHVFRNLSLFKSTFPVQNASVKLPNGATASITHIGTVCLTPSITLYSVLHVPSFSFNLISVSSLTSSMSCNVIFSPDSIEIQEASQAIVIGKGRRIGNLYSLDVKPDHEFTRGYSTSVPTSLSVSHPLYVNSVTIDVWHKRLGHLSYTS